MDRHDRIVCDLEILMGKPTIRGTRISVALILGWLGRGWSIEQILENYPQIQRDDVFAALSFASEALDSRWPNGRALRV
ncbi:MAG: hypothetical protein RLZ83_54 [Pseudomonadota bacterium]|jgi:uncharacterized protein (DUF433 family)